MSNTEFFQKIMKDDARITYADILSESFKRHSMKDIEYALSAGTAYNHADRNAMLMNWHKPWLWFYSFCAAFVVSFSLYLMTVWFSNIPTFGWTSVIFATLVTPIPFMIFLWELNIPRNISFLSLVGYFVTGGILSIFFSAVLINVGISGESVWWAPLAEEPGKLFAAWLLLRFYEKQGKEVYGCTGIVTGGGVGTGFTVFETIGYVLNSLSKEAGSLAYYNGGSMQGWINKAAPTALTVVLHRSLPCLAAHLLYCVPYVAVLTLVYHSTRSWKKSIRDRSFIQYFGISITLHALWNYFCGIAGLPGWLLRIGIASVSFYLVAKVIRQCLAQIIRESRSSNGAIRIPLYGKGISIVCNNAAQRGMTKTSNGDPITIGRDQSVCSLCYPETTNGVSRRHCRIFRNDSDWYVQDLGSTYGTYVYGKLYSPPRKIVPGKAVKLTPGDRLYLGSDRVYVTVML